MSYDLSGDTSETMSDMREEWEARFEQVDYVYANRPGSGGIPGVTQGTARVFKMNLKKLLEASRQAADELPRPEQAGQRPARRLPVRVLLRVLRRHLEVAVQALSRRAGRGDLPPPQLRARRVLQGRRDHRPGVEGGPRERHLGGDGRFGREDRRLRGGAGAGRAALPPLRQLPHLGVRQLLR